MKQRKREKMSRMTHRLRYAEYTARKTGLYATANGLGDLRRSLKEAKLFQESAIMYARGSFFNESTSHIARVEAAKKQGLEKNHVVIIEALEESTVTIKEATKSLMRSLKYVEYPDLKILRNAGYSGAVGAISGAVLSVVPMLVGLIDWSGWFIAGATLMGGGMVASVNVMVTSWNNMIEKIAIFFGENPVICGSIDTTLKKLNQHDRRDPAASCAVYLIRS